jgi:hypothetical protein
MTLLSARASVFLLIAIGLLTAAPSSSAAQSTEADVPPLVASRMSDGSDIQLDGRLDDAAWRGATPISDFTQQEPQEGGTPSQRTEVSVVYDDDNLYIGAMIFDDPDEILAFQRRRDAGLGTDDRFMWILDTFLDGRTGYFFEINAAGLMGDGIITGSGGGRGGGGGGGGGVNKSWDGIWEARVSRLPDGWSAEIRIPFRTVNFDPNSDTWGINFQRTVRRHNEEILWRGYRRNQGLWRVVNAGRLTGLQGMSQGVGLEAVPSAVAGWKNVTGNADPTTYPSDASLDLNYSVSSSLRASVSINTDFAEVEVDQRRVNLTRFPLRFPERRAFFLEGSGAFSFAPRSGPAPYFSRRIGLNGGEPIPITYGARLTGQAGDYELGFIQVRTDQHTLADEESTVLAPEDFTVARVKRRIWEQSTIGAVYTRRATAPDPSGFVPEDRHTGGVDVALNTASLFGDKNLEFEGFLAWNSNPDPAEDLSFRDLSAHGFRFNYPNDLWSGHISYRQFGDHYAPAVGFVTRNNFRRVEPRIGFSPRPEGISWLRKMDFSVQFRNLANLATGVVEERQWQINVLGLDFESGDNIDFTLTRQYEFLDDGFEVSDGVEIQPGEYTNWRFNVRGRTASRRRVSLNGEFAREGFWNGNRSQIEGGITFRPNPGISVSTDVEYNDVTLPQGAFTASVYRLETGWDASPWISLNGNVQYDDVSELVGLFALMRWIVKPGNDVYVVYTHNWQQLDSMLDPRERQFSTISRGASIKVNYTYRF